MKQPGKQSATRQGKDGVVVPTVASLIYQENWPDLRKHLRTESGVAEVQQTRSKNSFQSFFGQRETTPLHLACAQHPPLYIVQELTYLAPDDMMQMDKNQQTPLHVASLHGASADVLSFLIQRYKKAATEEDIHGKTPLHLSWEGGCFDTTCDCSKPLKRIAAMQALAYYAPESVLLTDKDSCTPLQCAVMCEADPAVVRGLNKITSRAIKRIHFQASQQKNAPLSSTSSSTSRGQKDYERKTSRVRHVKENRIPERPM